MKRFLIAVFLIICTGMYVSSAPKKAAYPNVSGTWAYGSPDGKAIASGIIIYQKDDLIYFDLSCIAQKPSIGFFIDSSTVWMNLPGLGKYYGRVVNDSWIEWTGNSFWTKVTPVAVAESAKLFDEKKGGAAVLDATLRADAVKGLNAKTFDGVNITRNFEGAYTGKEKSAYDRALEAVTEEQKKAGKGASLEGDIAPGKYLFVCEYTVTTGGGTSYEIRYQVINVNTSTTRANLEQTMINQEFNRTRIGRLETYRGLSKVKGDKLDELESLKRRHEIAGHKYSVESL